MADITCKACLSSFIVESCKSAVLLDLDLPLRAASVGQSHLVVAPDVRRSLSKRWKPVSLPLTQVGSSSECLSGLKVCFWFSSSICLVPVRWARPPSGSPNDMCHLWGNNTLWLKLGTPTYTGTTFLCWKGIYLLLLTWSISCISLKLIALYSFSPQN